MKRYTLAKACLCILLLTGFFTWLRILPEAAGERTYQGISFEHPLTAVGKVEAIEEKKNNYGQQQYILSLTSVTFCNGDFQNHKENKENKENKEKQTGIVCAHAKGVLCYLQNEQKLPQLGEWALVSGNAEHFKQRRNPGGFDAGFYYRTKGYDFLLRDAVLLKKAAGGGGIRQWLSARRKQLGDCLEQVCGRDAGLMQSLLLGDKTLLSGEIKKLYQRGGISHILAISGLHISFLGAGFYKLLKKLRLPIPIAAAASGCILVLYTVMTGLSPSARRAALMFLFCLMADVLRRSYERRTALAFAALVQVLQEPLSLGQSSFWLSYGAVFGLEMLSPPLCSLWENRLCRAFAGSLSVSLITLPVLLLSYYEFPVYSFLLNLAVIPLMSIVMGMGILSLLAGMLYLPAGRLLFYPVHLILCLFEALCRFSIWLPGDQWIIGKPSLWRILLYVSLLILFLLLTHYMTRTAALLILLGAVWILTGRTVLQGSVTILDVGQGDGIVIQGKDGSTVMIDGGSSSERALAEYTLLPYLRSQGIARIGYVFLTHMDSDHISGIKEMLEALEKGEGEIQIDALVLPKLDTADETYLDMVRLAQRSGIRVYTMQKGDRLWVSEMCFLCLNPSKETVYMDRNEASLVLYLQMEDHNALFMGDLDGEAERRFATDLNIWKDGVSLLKAGHHGSAAACSQELLEKVKPECTVISCGENNRYGHPAAETLERLEAAESRIFLTKECGAVRVEMKSPLFGAGTEKLAVTVESKERYVLK